MTLTYSGNKLLVIIFQLKTRTFRPVNYNAVYFKLNYGIIQATSCKIGDNMRYIISV